LLSIARTAPCRSLPSGPSACEANARMERRLGSTRS
jgi:hypothetical protein